MLEPLRDPVTEGEHVAHRAMTWLRVMTPQALAAMRPGDAREFHDTLVALIDGKETPGDKRSREYLQKLRGRDA